MGTVHQIDSVHPGVQMMQDWVVGLKEKTGRTLV